MRSRRTYLVALFSTAVSLLAGCDFDLANIASAKAEWHENGESTKPVELDTEAIELLVNWFRQRRSGWSTSIVSYVPAVLIRVEHIDGSRSVVNVLGNLLVVYGPNGQTARPISAVERQQLLALLQPK